MFTKYTLEDLEQLSGVSIRTIRYYIQEGLLEGPDTRGKFASYSQEHLEDLKLINLLKERTHLPLEEIRKMLRHTSPEQIQKIQDILNDPAGSVVIIDTDEPVEKAAPAPGAGALEYIRNINRVTTSIKEPVSPLPDSPDKVVTNNLRSSFYLEKNQDRIKIKEESWQRIHLDDGVELHLRAPRDRSTRKKIEELIEYARRLFGN